MYNEFISFCHRRLTALPLSCKCVHKCDKQSVNVQQIISASCSIGKFNCLKFETFVVGFGTAIIACKMRMVEDLYSQSKGGVTIDKKCSESP